MVANSLLSNKGGFKSVSTNEFKELITDCKVQLLDVRTPKEFKQCNIEGAVLINFYNADFENQVDALLDVSIPVAIYCRSGVRSVDAGLIMAKKGFNIYNLEEGIIAWE